MAFHGAWFMSPHTLVNGYGDAVQPVCESLVALFAAERKSAIWTAERNSREKVTIIRRAAFGSRSPAEHSS